MQGVRDVGAELALEGTEEQQAGALSDSLAAHGLHDKSCQTLSTETEACMPTTPSKAVGESVSATCNMDYIAVLSVVERVAACFFDASSHLLDLYKSEVRRKQNDAVKQSAAQSGSRSQPGTNSSTPPSAPMDLLSLRQLSTINAAAELVVWWGISPRLPTNARPSFPARRPLKSGSWVKPACLQFTLAAGEKIVRYAESGNSISDRQNSDAGTSEASEFCVHKLGQCVFALARLLVMPHFSAILLPNHMSDIIAGALMLSVAKLDGTKPKISTNLKAKAQALLEGLVQPTIEAENTNSVIKDESKTSPQKSVPFTIGSGDDSTFLTSLFIQAPSFQPPTTVVVGGLLRLLQDFNPKNSKLQRGSKTHIVIHKMKFWTSALLSALMILPGGVRIIASELLGHLVPPEGGSKASPAEMHVADLVTSVPQSHGKKPNIYFEIIMRQCLQLIAIGAASERGTHHSLIRVAVLVISRCCYRIPEETRRALMGQRPLHDEITPQGTKEGSQMSVHDSHASVCCTLQPLYDAGQMSIALEHVGENADGWKPGQVRQSITLACVLLLSVPAEPKLRALVRSICLAGLLRIYTAALSAKSASANLGLKDALLILLQTDEGSGAQEAGMHLFEAVIRQVDIHSQRLGTDKKQSMRRASKSIPAFRVCWEDMHDEEGSNELGGIALRATTVEENVLGESSLQEQMKRLFNPEAAFMMWLRSLGVAVIDEIVNSQNCPPGLAGSLLCCLVKHYASLCNAKQSKGETVKASTIHAIHEIEEDGDRSLIQSMMLLVHFIPRIVNGRNNKRLFHSPLQVLNCMRDVLQQVCPSSVNANKVDDEANASSSESSQIRESYHRTLSRVERDMNEANAVASQEQMNTEFVETQDWIEVAEIALQITLLLVEFQAKIDDGTEQSKRPEKVDTSTVPLSGDSKPALRMRGALREFLPILSWICESKNFVSDSLITKATTLRVLIVTGWHENGAMEQFHNSRDSNGVSESIAAAVLDTRSQQIPLRALGAIKLKKIVLSFAELFVAKKDNQEVHGMVKQIVVVLLDLLFDTDSYVFLASIQALAATVDAAPTLALPMLLDAFVDAERSLYQRAKLGEALALASRRCGEMLPHYAEALVDSFLLCAAPGSDRQLVTAASASDAIGRHDGGIMKYLTSRDASASVALSDDQQEHQVKLAVEAFRASCLSNLADVCMTLKGNVKPYAQRICNVIISLLHLEGRSTVGPGSASEKLFGEVIPEKVLIEVLDAETFGEKHPDDAKPHTVEDGVVKGRRNLPKIHSKIGAGRSVRRAGTFVLCALIRAGEKDVLRILAAQNMLKRITTVLQYLEASDNDKITRFHAQNALLDLAEYVRHSLMTDHDDPEKNNRKRNVFKISLKRAYQ